jgi:hypothetical protein
MAEELVDIFVEQVNCSFRFLSEQHGFSEPTAQIDRRAGQVTVTYVKDAVAVEAICDLREGDVEIYVVRLDKGRRPAGFNVDPEGRRFRASLVEILIGRGMRQFGLRAPASGDENQRERLKRLLDRYRALLESHGGDILAGSAAMLDSSERGT